MTPLLFLKFADPPHVTSLMSEGEIYMRLNESFRKNHPNKERFDRFEGAISNWFFNEGVIQLKEANDRKAEWKNLKVTQTNINQFTQAAYYTYSLYSITIEDLQESDNCRIDGRMKSFGSHFLMIRNPGDFVNRIASYLETNHYNYRVGFVEYYDTKQNWTNLNPFNKPDSLQHQKEFRIIVEAKTHENLKFSIGGLEKYCDIFSTEHLENFLFKQ